MPFQKANQIALIGLGLIAGVIQVMVGAAMYVAGVYFKPWSMLVSVLVLLLCIVVGTRWYSVKFLHNEITYKQAVIVGGVIAISTGIIYAVYNLVSIGFFYPNFLDELVRDRIAQRQAPASFDSLRAAVSAPGIAIANLIRLSVIGSLLSVLCALFLRRRSKAFTSG